MPFVAELYGQLMHDKSNMDLDACRRAWCVFRDDRCDGGGNRPMARVEASDPSIGHLFSQSVGESTNGWLPCGVCSVQGGQGVWAICPHRLFAIGPQGVASKHKVLGQRVFRLAGFLPGDEVSVWSEVTLSEESFRYRLDYVLRDRAANSPPVIVEVMACSTSGGNRRKGTDMKAVFKRSTLYAHTPVTDPVRSPTANIRQVWARMASQLIAKSEAANSWGGRTIWIVQDLLAEYIRTKTALPLDDLYSPDWRPNEVNMVVVGLDGPSALFSGPIRSSGGDRRCWLEILGAPHKPSLFAISAKLSGKQPLTTLRVHG